MTQIQNNNRNMKSLFRYNRIGTNADLNASRRLVSRHKLWGAVAFATLLAVGSLLLNTVPAAELRPAEPALVKTLEVIGRGLASKADEKLKSEVGKYARENVFGITGDLIPNGEVTYLRGGLYSQDGRSGVVMEFRVHARAKIDVGTRKLFVDMVRKVWGVDTVQIVQILIAPKQHDNGSVAANVSAELVSATATPEREAKQRDADGFRDRVSKEIKGNLSQFTGEHDLKQLLRAAGQ